MTRDEWTTAARRILATPKATDAWKADQLYQLHVDTRVVVNTPTYAESMAELGAWLTEVRAQKEHP